MDIEALHAAAANYVARGLPVIALTGKTPNVKVHRRGLHDARTELAGLSELFDHPDTTGVGIVIPYPYVVVDIDGEEGAQVWKDMLGGDPGLGDPEWVARTGRGLHAWFSCITPTGSMKLGEKLDLKGQNSYVAAPPSRHPDGHIYEWLLAPGEIGDHGPREVPDALGRIIQEHVFDLDRKLTSKQHSRKVRHEPFDGAPVGDSARLWASVGFDHLIEGMEHAADGNRNNYLHWAAATMAEEGATDEEFLALRAAALAAGLLVLEVRRTIRSARAQHG
jgi:Bifunctional DNA primase/polymerase, N-terminal.